jgi:hypothetical protein
MTGSDLVYILAPLVALPALGLWLAMVYYADTHPAKGASGWTSAAEIPGAAASGGGQGVTAPAAAAGESDRARHGEDAAEHAGPQEVLTPSLPGARAG